MSQISGEMNSSGNEFLLQVLELPVDNEALLLAFERFTWNENSIDKCLFKKY